MPGANCEEGAPGRSPDVSEYGVVRLDPDTWTGTVWTRVLQVRYASAGGVARRVAVHLDRQVTVGEVARGREVENCLVGDALVASPRRRSPASPRTGEVSVLQKSGGVRPWRRSSRRGHSTL